MKNKILMITAALAVMIAMTGIAAASAPYVPSGQFKVPVDGTPVSTTVGYTWECTDATNPVSLDTYITDLSNIASTKLLISLDGGSTWASSQTHSLAKPTCSGVTETATKTILVKNNGGLVNDQYKIKHGVTGAPAADFIATIFVLVIPEFATVAIPIAAVLGLVFIFQQRKNKKE